MLDNKFSVDKLLLGKEIYSNQTIRIEGQKILSIEDGICSASSHLEGTLVPGFIDIQVNGGGGHLFNESPSIESIIKIGESHQKFGTTGWLPTLVTDSLKNMYLASDAVAQAISNRIPGVLGIHFEGPHLSISKKGVHSDGLIRKMNEQEKSIYLRKDIGQVIVTMAPESISPNDIRVLSEAGVIVCLGHSNASFEQTNIAIESGAKGFTHLFNAMSQVNSREPGMVGAALLNKECYSGLILDGIHVHPASAKLALQLSEKLMLVTDAMPPVGSEKMKFKFFGQTIERINNTLRDNEGRLAGSVLDMATAVINAQEMLDLSLAQSVDLASINPAKFLGIENKYGTIEAGKNASMLLLNEQGIVLNNWIDGKQIF